MEDDETETRPKTQELQVPYVPVPVEPKHRKTRSRGEVAYRILEIVVGSLFLGAGVFSASLVMGLVCGVVAAILFWGRKRP